ncbi:hypothetical protein H6P81_010176 [Aristolochia fimbriata]|uniref:Uncharacterized protein n=1 Tax=Aristolochia fimbriata TaxID=158543 RepID=A0AAV7ERF0_ARIFI|nr:hypothetical protein H6P81_010176 [Aristolochia fimbriata]
MSPACSSEKRTIVSYSLPRLSTPSFGAKIPNGSHNPPDTDESPFPDFPMREPASTWLPGKCSLHRNARRNSGPRPATHATAAISANGRLDSSLQKSLRAILLQIIRPSNQNLRRRRNFHPRPSRFSVMNGGNTDRGVTVS